MNDTQFMLWAFVLFIVLLQVIFNVIKISISERLRTEYNLKPRKWWIYFVWGLYLEMTASWVFVAYMMKTAESIEWQHWVGLISFSLASWVFSDTSNIEVELDYLEKSSLYKGYFSMQRKSIFALTVFIGVTGSLKYMLLILLVMVS